MSNNVKKTLKNFFFGEGFKGLNVDERIKQGAEQAGNYSFWVVMICLWLAMILFGFIFDDIKLASIPLIIFLIGCIAYSFFRVKNGSFLSGINIGQSRTKIIWRYVWMGFVYGLMMFIFNIRDIEIFTFDNIYPEIIRAVINGAMFIFFFHFFGKFLSKKSEKVLDKKMNTAE